MATVPPQTIISVPVQMVVCPARGAGEPLASAVQVPVPGTKVPPFLKNLNVEVAGIVE